MLVPRLEPMDLENVTTKPATKTKASASTEQLLFETLQGLRVLPKPFVLDQLGIRGNVVHGTYVPIRPIRQIPSLFLGCGRQSWDFHCRYLLC